MFANCTKAEANRGISLCVSLIQGIQMEGIRNKKFISQKLSYVYPVYVIRKENSESFFSCPTAGDLR
jgi:hypothetical protein